MEAYYAMSFVTEYGNTVNVRITKAIPDLPKSIAVAAMDKIMAANCFDVKQGALTVKKSLQCVKTYSTPIDLDE